MFEQAIERQAKDDSKRVGAGIRCFVFMDEAGLPEEERESLKVLHYYLENHMSVAAQVPPPSSTPSYSNESHCTQPRWPWVSGRALVALAHVPPPRPAPLKPPWPWVPG